VFDLDRYLYFVRILDTRFIDETELSLHCTVKHQRAVR